MVPKRAVGRWWGSGGGSATIRLMHSSFPVPWDRLPGESQPAYKAFLAYRDAGGCRSVRSLARQVGKSRSLLFRWSSRHRWTARAQAWDMARDFAAEDREREDHECRLAHLRRAIEKALLGHCVPGIAMEERFSEDPNLFEALDVKTHYELALKGAASLPRLIRAEREFIDLRASGDGSLVDPRVAARAKAEKMSREEAEEYLLGKLDPRRKDGDARR